MELCRTIYTVKSFEKEIKTNTAIIENMESTSEKLTTKEAVESELHLFSNVIVEDLPRKSKPENDTKQQDHMALCDICKRAYKSKASLSHHLRVKHGFINRSRMKMPCLESGCNYKCNRIARLITHLIQVHEKKFECEKVSFENKEDFWKWKDEAEKRCKSSYTTHTSPKKDVGGNEKYFYQCRRSGFTKKKKATESSEERLNTKLMKRESIKINGVCTSFMKVLFEKDKSVVNFCRTHYGHPEDAKYLRMNDKEKLLIEALIIQGLTAAQIISIMKTKIPPDRHQLLKYSNIRNISQKKNLFLSRRLYSFPRKLSVDEFILEGMQSKSDDSSLNLLVDNEVEVQEQHILDESFQDSYNSVYKIEMHSKADDHQHQLQLREMELLRSEIHYKIERLANLTKGFNSIGSLKSLNSDLDTFIEKVDAKKDIELIKEEDLSTDNEVIPIECKNIAFSKDDDGNSVTVVCYN